jgi:hypothetical protein
MRLPKPTANPGGGRRPFPSYMRVRARGCYGYHLGGTNFSTVVVIRGVEGADNVPAPSARVTSVRSR